MSTAPPGSSYERSISIDTSESDSEYEEAFSLGKNTISHHNFETDINRLKAESSSKFRRRWDEIIAKFSAIDDNIESDEIDLHSGKITIDNGHLRSLRGADTVIDGVRVHTSIWAGDYDFEKQLQHQKRQQKSVSQDKQELKQKLKAESRFHHSGTVTSDSDALEDNLSILGSSPTKRTRTGQLDSPYSTSSLRSPRSKDASPNRPTRAAGSSPLKNSMYSSPSASPRRKARTQTPKTQKIESFIDSQSPESSFEQNSLLEWHQVPELALYTCAFRGCRKVFESRSSYRSHLLQAHACELSAIGYPVAAPVQTSTPLVDEITILKLNLHFPLQVEVPEIDPTVCGMAVGENTCQKLFFDKNELVAHRGASPTRCSARRQVLPCAILGCTFMTDVGFHDYKKHLLAEHQAHVPQRYIPIKVDADVSEYFSDSVSSFSFSDSEPEAKTRPRKQSSVANFTHTRPPPLDIVD